jgi:predicted SAM-dependent methyltransferase
MKDKLNLGCGNDIRQDYVNLDISALEGVDVVHDLKNLPLPFDDGRFREILCLDVFEHLEHYPLLLKECHRILRPGARIIIEVPRFSSNNNFVDPTHRARFSVKT